MSIGAFEAWLLMMGFERLGHGHGVITYCRPPCLIYGGGVRNEVMVTLHTAKSPLQVGSGGLLYTYASKSIAGSFASKQFTAREDKACEEAQAWVQEALDEILN